MGPSQRFGGTGEQRYLFQENKGNKDLQMRGTWEQRQFWGTGNIGNADLIFRNKRTMRFISVEQGNRYLREGLMHAFIISPFKRKELQLTFYANATTHDLHGRLCRNGEHIELYLQYLNNSETVTSTVESEHDKTNTLICRPSEFIISLGILSV